MRPCHRFEPLLHRYRLPTWPRPLLSPTGRALLWGPRPDTEHPQRPRLPRCRPCWWPPLAGARPSHPREPLPVSHVLPAPSASSRALPTLAHCPPPPLLSAPPNTQALAQPSSSSEHRDSRLSTEKSYCGRLRVSNQKPGPCSGGPACSFSTVALRPGRGPGHSRTSVAP